MTSDLVQLTQSETVIPVAKPPRLGLARRLPWGSLIELTLIAAWALWVGRAYLNMNPLAWPRGGEFGMALEPTYIWNNLLRCGDCVFWNGAVQGGAPAFVDLHGVVLHPAVILSTMIWGGVNGAKVTILIALVMAGWAQWWLAHVVGLGRAARLWSAALAVAGGHLAGRLDSGLYQLVLATASASLTIAPALYLALTGKRRAAIALAVMLALTMLSGQGYMQLGLAVGLFPALLVFFVDSDLRLRPVWKGFALALGLALLLAAVFWLPLAHFWPNLAKALDPNFTSAQGLEFVPFNLVIRDMAYLRGAMLGKQPYPYLYANYVGWGVVILALLGVWLAPRESRRVVLFCLLGIGCLYLAASAQTFRWLAAVAPTFATGVRNPALIAGLVVPLVLLLAAWGVDRLFALRWPRLSWRAENSERRVTLLSAAWLLWLPLFFTLEAVVSFSQEYLKLENIPAENREVIAALRTESTQWVQPPFGELFWLPLATEAGLKTSITVRPWHWQDHPQAPIFLDSTRNKDAANAPGFLHTIRDVNFVSHPENEYAAIRSADKLVSPCRARSVGGYIDVECDSEAAGTLVVYEYSWQGWTAKRDGQALTLGPGPWLNVFAPAGTHHYELRYRPWDVPLGLALSLVGVVLCIWLWIRAKK
jgi:hypothetical protein